MKDEFLTTETRLTEMVDKEASEIIAYAHDCGIG